MPLINGMKMACEPCIRGHRSTKCTHANERLMVPVRKPGRPLSQCPHPGGQTCMCGSVTAAIPRKQTCHCGSGPSSSTPAQSPQIVPRTTSNASSELSSPTKSTFKVQKATRPPSGGRKQSFDPSNFERMDMNSVNILPYKQHQNISTPISSPEPFTMANPAYSYTAQYANIQPQYSQISMQPPPPVMYGTSGPMIATSGFANGMIHKEPYPVESPLATPTSYMNGGSTMNGNSNRGGSCCGTQTEVVPRVEPKPVKNGGSCCAPKPKSHSQTSSVASARSEPQESKPGGCCSSKPVAMKQENVSGNGVSKPASPNMQHQVLPQASMSYDPNLYSNYMPQPTVFTYPPTYGSFQNPLQPEAWRQGIRSNYASQQGPIPIPPGGLPFDASRVPQTMDTIHTCTCGDTCQCIGCAAHPYNDATQDYVRSAWASMSAEQSTPIGTNGMNGMNGTNGTMQPQSSDMVSSPTAHTPSSNASANGEEQSLSASDFFFVSYPFSSDGCGGDNLSCPCGDDCECLGCTIHRQPNISYT
ncbi:hypothetical protein B0J14DRAFT_473651 [Halenospora varia]|nr:hypothetical protein B0J14DRAFT_473651 [Halenospora varia]